MNNKMNGMRMSDNTVQVWSSGGGVQSCAIAALIIQGAIPKPDYSVIVDTGRECQTTWDYNDEFIVPALQKVGVTLHRVKKEEYATMDLYSGTGALLVPVFTDESGTMGKFPTYCSTQWKKRIVERWLREREPTAKSFEIMLGMSLDEASRIKLPTGKYTNSYPLIKLKLTRQDCLEIALGMFGKQPPKSTCWMCPNKTDAQWKWMKKYSANDFLKAIEFERKLRLEDDTLYLHSSGVTLDLVDFNENQTELFQCNTGHCFV